MRNGTRTRNRLVHNQMLHQLSYTHHMGALRIELKPPAYQAGVHNQIDETPEKVHARGIEPRSLA